MNSIIDELEKYYLNFKLGEEQRDALLSIFNFIHNKEENQCSLVGSAGSGKSSITRLIIWYLEQQEIRYIIAAPTHKAKRVISEHTERDVTTIHQLLSLKPTLDILELDFKDLRFSSNTLDNGIPRDGILIIDEASMINEALFDYITEQCVYKNCKVIFILDEKQLQPIKDYKLSKATRINLVFRLNKIYRQKDDNPILDILSELREKTKYSFKEIISENGNLILYNNWQKLIGKNLSLFKQAVQQENPNIVKLLAYTNRRVDAFNGVIRKAIFNNDDEYNEGDILMAHDSCEYKTDRYMSYKLFNSNDYIVKEVFPTTKFICGILTKGFELELYSVYEGFSLFVYILSLENSMEVFNAIAYNIENIRFNAINCKNKKDQKKIWVEYFKLMGSFLTPIDMSFQGRIIRNRSLGYGYCLSVHKSQGSSFDNVLVDMENILRCTNKQELRQLQYVSMSRTRKDIHMLIK